MREYYYKITFKLVDEDPITFARKDQSNDLEVLYDVMAGNIKMMYGHNQVEFVEMIMISTRCSDFKRYVNNTTPFIVHNPSFKIKKEWQAEGQKKKKEKDILRSHKEAMEQQAQNFEWLERAWSNKDKGKAQSFCLETWEGEYNFTVKPLTGDGVNGFEIIGPNMELKLIADIESGCYSLYPSQHFQSAALSTIQAFLKMKGVFSWPHGAENL